MAQQLSFDLPARPALDRGDFFVSPANALAVALIDAPDAWPAHKLILVGPQGSGKTHLAHVWAAQTSGTIIDAGSLPDLDIPAACTKPVALENAETVAGNKIAETAFFHLHNLMASEGQPLLLTARTPAARWALTLPDLASRMGAVQQVELAPPDDALLSAVMMKLFSDRQIRPAPDVIPYLARRIDRSFAAAARIVADLDRAALEQGRPLTRALAASVLDN